MSDRSAARADFAPLSSDVPVVTGEAALDALVAFFDRHARVFVLGGAGVSTASGIPDYRDEHGQRKGRDPILLQDFLKSELARKRYWARNMIGWPTVRQARPNAAHRALAELGAMGRIERLVTQNVDGLHRAAGSEHVIELHGNIADVICMTCGHRHARDAIQVRLEAENPDWLAMEAVPLPDGDARLESARFDRFRAPACECCGGVIKPDVVFFGEGVPRARVEDAMASLARADAMLVVGSSLMVYSGFRFCEQAARAGTPIVAINIGRTRADGLLSLKIPESLVEILPALVERLGASASVPAATDASCA
ncbi:NAD-dependent protein deacetylase [Pararobbsia silviterrae]|uniref:NAD-dependent protein deacetylase n=1 Tax=Pararobbsia silviterrae TaxID=1792498 RepID=A0A494XQB3_9BURK|nr:NAD-dependent protein deacetylase [Pararobbsia silviterrae]RKP51992.1 NAD-dependent protein deacetylase [Pararobbsia silviterrae]